MQATEPCFQTVLIVQSTLEDAFPIQDRLVEDGFQVLTAYSLSRALLLAENTKLSCAMIDARLNGSDQIVEVLGTRKVPIIFHSTADHSLEKSIDTEPHRGDSSYIERHPTGTEPSAAPTERCANANCANVISTTRSHVRIAKHTFCCTSCALEWSTQNEKLKHAAHSFAREAHPLKSFGGAVGPLGRLGIETRGQELEQWRHGDQGQDG